MSSTPKIGDKVYCLKDAYCNYLLFKENNEYTISRIYKNYMGQDVITVSLNDNDSFEFVVTSEFDYIYTYHTYFGDIKEFRKRKLEKLFKECH